MFFLLSFLLYIHGRLEQKNWRQWILFCSGFLTWIMALGCKEIAATLPLIILIYEWYFFQNLSLAWLKKNMKYLLGLLAVLGIISILYFGGNPMEKIASAYGYRDFTMEERVLTQSRVVFFYMSLLLFPLPSRLNLIHQFQISNSLLDPVTTLISIMFIFGLIVLAFYIAHTQRIFSFCILWVFINLAIESSIIALELIFEHRLYLPMVGFAFTVSWLLYRFYSKRPLLIIGISIAVIAALSIGTYARNGVYENPVIFWSDVLSKNPKATGPTIVWV